MQRRPSRYDTHEVFGSPRPPDVGENRIETRMVGQRIDVGDKFRRVALPKTPPLQPPDFTSYPTGAKKIGLISQIGLMKRKADAESFKTRIALDDTHEVFGSPRPPDVGGNRIETRMVGQRINVGNKFRRVAVPRDPLLQPSDFTSYPRGVKKIGLISQVGLMKRKADAESVKTRIGLAVGKAKQYSNTGFLAMVDRFFVWVNQAIGA